MSTTESSPEQILADALEARNSEVAEVVRDGRRLRAERGRSAVVQATFDLIQEGGNPTIAEIADRAGISERTVFRYFPDRDTLMAAVASEVVPLVAPLLEATRPDGDLATRARALVAARVELIRIGGQFARSVEMNAPRSQLAKDLIALRVERLRSQTGDFLAPEISAAGSFALPVIDGLLSHHSIGELRTQMDDEQVVEALLTAVLRLLQS